MFRREYAQGGLFRKFGRYFAGLSQLVCAAINASSIAEFYGVRPIDLHGTSDFVNQREIKVEACATFGMPSRVFRTICGKCDIFGARCNGSRFLARGG